MMAVAADGHLDSAEAVTRLLAAWQEAATCANPGRSANSALAELLQKMLEFAEPRHPPELPPS